jgi:O-antigen ligase
MPRWESIVFWALLAVVLLSPLPLGSDRPLPAGLLGAAIDGLVLAWAAGVLLGVVQPHGRLRGLLPAAALFGGTVAWAFTQGSSLTPAFVHHPDWAAAGAVLNLPVAGAISVNPEATWTRLQILLADAGVFWLAFHIGADRRRAHQALLALALGGLVYAGYGLHGYFGQGGPVTSTFVNRNSYATYAGITLFCGLGLVVERLARHAGRGLPLSRTLLQALAGLDFTMTVAILSCVAGAAALLLTQSRGALVAVAAALLLYLWLLRRTLVIPSRALYALVLALMLASAGALIEISGQETLGRFAAAGANLEDRIAYDRATWTALKDRPLLGTGYATFADAFMAYNDPATGTYFLDKAHNSYLQLLMELGWPAALALFLSIGCLVFRCWQGLLASRRDRAYLATVLAGSVLVAVHSLVDFSLEMPANAVTYALLLGLGCARALGADGAAAEPAGRGGVRSGAKGPAISLRSRRAWRPGGPIAGAAPPPERRPCDR